MKFLLLNQTFHPDVTATGQYLSDVALALVERGHQVTVVASRRAYDAPYRVFPTAEVWRGIRILRVSATWFGKGAKWKRAADFSSFIALCSARLISLRKQDVVLALTSPPLIASLGAWIAKLRGSRFVYWVMDLNPDEAIAAGWIKADSLVAKLLERISRRCLKRAEKILVLDCFMQARILAKGIPSAKIAVLPLWSRGICFDAAGRNHFRRVHRIETKFVVMYSGNHSPCHPLDSLLEAAARLAHDPEILFCFVGGGSEFRKLQQLLQKANRPNILCLPYQPLAQLAGSLSAADLHVVIMGEQFVGLVHPCKIYNLLNLGTPILYIGPDPSPVTQLLAAASRKEFEPTLSCNIDAAQPRSDPGALHFQAQPSEVDRIVKHIRRARWCANPSRRPVALRASMDFSSRSRVASLLAQLELPSRLIAKQTSDFSCHD